MKFVIKHLYTEYQTSIRNFHPPFMTVSGGVLQVDCVSLLLFNSFIQYINAHEFGFSFKMLNPLHWFQFADYAAVTACQESEN